MKDEKYTEAICKKFCRFYHPEKEEFKCGAYSFLENNLSIGELLRIAEKTGAFPDRSMDNHIKALACSKCDFLPEDCSFRKGLSSSPPCGGYVVIEKLLGGGK